MKTSPVQEVVKAIQNAIQVKLHAVKKMELNYELPYSDWLFDLVSENLCELGLLYLHMINISFVKATCWCITNNMLNVTFRQLIFCLVSLALRMNPTGD